MVKINILRQEDNEPFPLPIEVNTLSNIKRGT